MPRNPEDIPITSASYRVRGDIYSSGSDNPDVRIIDSSAQQSIFGTSANAGGTAVDPNLATTLPSGTTLGFGGVLADYLATGLYNSSFFLPPNSLNDPIEDNNPLPYWTVGGTAVSPITWSRYSDGLTNPYLLLYSNGLTLNDDVYIEQTVPMRGFNGNGSLWGRADVNVSNSSGSVIGLSVLMYISMTYLTEAGSVIRTIEATKTTTVLAGPPSNQDIIVSWDGANSYTTFIPSNTAYVRVRVGVRSLTNIAVGAGILSAYVTSVRLMRSQDALILSSPASLTDSVAGVRWNGTRNSFESIAYNNTTNAMYPWSPVIITMPFTFNALAGTASNLMQPWDNAVNQGTPYIDMPYRGTVIGLSYRISGSPTAGTFNVRARTGGGTFLLSTGALGTAAPLTDSVKQNINTAAGQFTASTAIGVQVTTSGLTPTTLNISVLMYVALDVSQV